MDLGVQTEETWLESLAGSNRWIYCCSWGTTREGECFFCDIYILWWNKTDKLFVPNTYLVISGEEREARAAEDGWAVVHHKGRKKTTDAETGIAVGSVSLAAMQHKMAKMKPKEVDMNFYRFQRREAHLSGMSSLLNMTYYLLFHSVLLHMIEPRLYIAHYEVLGLGSCNAMQFTSHDKM